MFLGYLPLIPFPSHCGGLTTDPVRVGEEVLVAGRGKGRGCVYSMRDAVVLEEG